MDTKEIKINCPEGYEIDKENSTFECIKFKPIEEELPKTWEEYCRTHKRQHEESWIDDDSNIKSVAVGNIYYKNAVKDKNILPSKELAEAVLALCQLIQLRDCYNDGWVLDWTNLEPKFVLNFNNNTINKDRYQYAQEVLAFKSEELRDQFLENFQDLIKIAKPLL